MSGFSQLNPVPVAVGGTGDTGSAWASYVPVITSSAGTITTVGAVTGFYKTIGKTCFVRGSVAITTIGTATGRMIISLPVNTVGAGAGNIAGFNPSTQQNSSGIAHYDAANKAGLSKDADGTFPATTGESLYFAGQYETA